MKETPKQQRYMVIAGISKNCVEITEKTVPIIASEYLRSLDIDGLRAIKDFVDMQLFIKKLRAH